jgi:hypothetical protein
MPVSFDHIHEMRMRVLRDMQSAQHVYQAAYRKLRENVFPQGRPVIIDEGLLPVVECGVMSVISGVNRLPFP